MANQGSYDLSSFSTGTKSEIKRLDAQIDLFWNRELACYRRFGVVDGVQIVDIGSGTGRLIELLSAAFPSAELTGIEQDEILVESARTRLKDNGNVTQIFHSEIEAVDFGKARFDVAFMRLVLEHVPDPAIVLKKVTDLLKPGGLFVVVDNDFDYHLKSWPDVPELEPLYAAYRASRRHDGGDPCIGRRLPLLLKNAGFTDVDLEIICAHSEIVGDRAFLNSEGGGIPAQLVKSGFFEEAAFDVLVKHWNAMLKADEHALYRQLFVAKGRRPKDSINRRVDTKTASSKTEVVGGTQKTQSVRDVLATRICRELGLSASELDESQSLIDAGLDSAGALEVQAAIETVFGVNVKISDLIGGLTFAEVISLIETQKDRSVEETRPCSSPDTDDGECGSV